MFPQRLSCKYDDITTGSEQLTTILVGLPISVEPSRCLNNINAATSTKFKHKVDRSPMNTIP